MECGTAARACDDIGVSVAYPLPGTRFHEQVKAQLGAKTVDMLLEGQNNCMSTLQWSQERGFYVDSYDGNALRDRWGHIHARQMHPSFYDPQLMRPSRQGMEYLLPIFTNASRTTGSSKPSPMPSMNLVTKLK